MEETKIKLIQQLDSPVSVNNLLLDEFLYGITEDFIEELRENSLSSKKEDIE